MKYVEEALIFKASGASLLGILSRPEGDVDCGVLIVVGGPQYRVGSHRQFLLLARRLAAAGYPALRFDVRGMGDSDGDVRSFEDLTGDIGAAIAAFKTACPALERVVLWGLCDAASVALLYVEAVGDSGIAGLVLANPWVRSEASLARTQIKHYYAQRLLQRDFWIKLMGGKLAVFQSLCTFLKTARSAREPDVRSGAGERLYQERMAEGLRNFRGPVQLILSGQDYTAKEFIEFTGTSAVWSGLLDGEHICRVELSDADHTFSSAASRAMVEDATLAWLNRLRRDGGNSSPGRKSKSR